MQPKVKSLKTISLLSSWIGISLVCLVVVMPAKQLLYSLEAAQIEQLELNDSDSEKESKEKIKKIDSDYFLVKSISVQTDFHVLAPSNNWESCMHQENFQTNFDPPPEQ